MYRSPLPSALRYANTIPDSVFLRAIIDTGFQAKNLANHFGVTYCGTVQNSVRGFLRRIKATYPELKSIGYPETTNRMASLIQHKELLEEVYSAMVEKGL